VSFIHRLAPLIAVFLCFSASGSVVGPSTPVQQLQRSAAVFRGTVLGVESYQDPSDTHIYTAAYVRVDEAFKGIMPDVVKLVHRGGTLAFGGERDGFAPQLSSGEEGLFFVSRRANGTLYARLGTASIFRLADPRSRESAAGVLKQLRDETAGRALAGEDITDQAVSSAGLALPAGAGVYGPPPSFTPHSDATNLLVGTDLIPARFIVPDTGEAIPYYVDADVLPTGVSLAQALDAVASALSAWTNATSIRVKFAGLQSFGMAAPNLPLSDASMRIQLHDTYGFIPGTGEILGQGGRSWTSRNLSPGWTLGGNVQGNDFHRVTKGYVVLKHTAAFLQNPSNLAEVLCHEVGHAIGVAHSSENANETSPVLKEAIMYYLAHGSGRGATLAAFDMNTCRQIHPQFDTPPFTFDRVIEVVTTPSPQSFSVPGVNSAMVPAYDLQTGPLEVAIADPSAPNGEFHLGGSTVTYVPSAFFGEASGELDYVYARCSDGVNAAPYRSIRVIAFRPDDYSEGVPNSWRLTFFSSEDPNLVPGAHASDDPDADGFPNVTEFLLGSDPQDKESNLRITSFVPGFVEWQTKPRELYEIQGSTNLLDWTLAALPVTATNQSASLSALESVRPHQFFRVLRVP
jgi:hypothetical protein